MKMSATDDWKNARSSLRATIPTALTQPNPSSIRSWTASTHCLMSDGSRRLVCCHVLAAQLNLEWYVDSGSQVGELQTLTLVGVFDIVLVSKHNSSCVPVCTHSHDLTKAVSVKSSTEFGLDLKNTLVGPGTPPPPG